RARQSRHLHPADLVHRPAGGGGAGAAQTFADRDPDRCRALARGHCAAHRARARGGRHGRHRDAVDQRSKTREEEMTKDPEIDLPDVVAEVRTAFERYEKALVSNDVATLNAIFRNDPRTIRYGGAEILYGHAAIAAFRGARSPVGLARTLSKTVITTYGRDFAVASTLFQRASAPGKVGRPMQTWVRFADRLLAPQVSLSDARPATPPRCRPRPASRRRLPRPRPSPRSRPHRPPPSAAAPWRRSCGSRSPTTSCAVSCRPAPLLTRRSWRAASA